MAAALLTALATGFPEVQAKLRAHVDAATPRDRMPTVEDMEKTPYARAFVTEALRWRGSNRYGLPVRLRFRALYF
jgi:cytochrome P450